MALPFSGYTKGEDNLERASIFLLILQRAGGVGLVYLWIDCGFARSIHAVKEMGHTLLGQEMV